MVGQNIVLAPFQIDFIIDIYDNPRKPKVHVHTAFLSMARKNAKTATIACLTLAHICGPEAKQNSQVISGAMSRDQAAIVFALAAKMIGLDPRLTKVCKITPSGKKIIGLAKNVEYRALSADGSTAHGLSPILAIMDEVGQVKGPTSPFIEAITTSQGAHDEPLIIYISTQAPSDADFLSIQIDDAIRSNDPAIVVHLYAADKDCDLLDKKQWKKANPALGLFRSKPDLEKQLKKAARMPSLEASQRNLLLNQRVALESLWLAPTVWRENSGKPLLEPFRRYPVAVGLDLSSRHDLTAAVYCCRDLETDIVHIIPHVFTPIRGLEERSQTDRTPYDVWVREGKMYTAGLNSVDYGDMMKHLVQWEQENGINVNSIEYDRWRIEVVERESKELGWGLSATWNPIGQGYKDFSPRIERFEQYLLDRKIRHGSHPLLNLGAANAIAVKDPAGSIKLDKSKSTQRIDPIVAAVMGLFGVAAQENKGFDVELLIG